MLLAWKKSRDDPILYLDKTKGALDCGSTLRLEGGFLRKSALQ